MVGGALVVCALFVLNPLIVSAFYNGEAASIVIGQSNFTSNSYSTSQTGIALPMGAAFDSSGNLWVADSHNSRILEFESPFTNGEAASVVLGQTQLRDE